MTRPSPESDYGVPAVSPATPAENNSRNNAAMDANMSQHFDVAASVRPTYLLAGGTWAKDAGVSPQQIEVYLYDGTADILLYTVDVATGKIVTASDTVPGVVELATQTEQEAGNDTGRVPTSATQQFHQSAAKAWGHFDGTVVTLEGGYNTDSLTDNGVGDYTVNFTNNMADVNYAGGCSCNASLASSSNSGIRLDTYATGSVGIAVVEAGAVSDEANTVYTISGDLA